MHSEKGGEANEETKKRAQLEMVAGTRLATDRAVGCTDAGLGCDAGYGIGQNSRLRSNTDVVSVCEIQRNDRDDERADGSDVVYYSVDRDTAALLKQLNAFGRERHCYILVVTVAFENKVVRVHDALEFLVVGYMAILEDKSKIFASMD